MDQDYKVLAQFAPFATTDTDLYSVPAGTQAVVSTLAVANRSASVAGAYRIAVVPSGETLENKHYIAYDVTVDAKDTALLTIGLTLGPLDKLIVRASTADFTFNLFGVEFS
jgi:hypothetical protein